MARRRMIDPHFWESGDVKKMDIFSRYVFISMFSHADDEGRGIGSAVYIRNVTFPLEDVPLSKIKKAIEQIQNCVSIRFYKIGDEEYYQLSKWSDWQRVDKPQRSLLPVYSENDSKNESENDSCLKEKKIKEDKGKEDNTPAPVVAEFKTFWDAYPKKISKQAAQKAWMKLKPDNALLAIMLTAIETQKKSKDWTKDEGQFIPYPATWINQRRWEDEVTSPPTSPPKVDDETAFKYSNWGKPK